MDFTKNYCTKKMKIGKLITNYVWCSSMLWLILYNSGVQYDSSSNPTNARKLKNCCEKFPLQLSCGYLHFQGQIKHPGNLESCCKRATDMNFLITSRQSTDAQHEGNRISHYVQTAD